MRVKIDKSGRIVPPKRVRDRLHLTEGTHLALEELPDGVMLRLIEQRPSMVKQDGIWVHLGQAGRGFDWARQG